jgi:hypothetical protein
MGTISASVAAAANGPCEIEIAGATVSMSREEFVAAMSARGLHDRSKENTAYVRTGRLDNIADFSSTPPGSPMGPEDYAVTWTRMGDGGIKIFATYKLNERSVELFEQRIATFCPDPNRHTRSAEVACVGKTPTSINLISKNPEDPDVYPQCAYGGGMKGPNFSESVTLRNKNTVKTKEYTDRHGKKRKTKTR